MKKFYSILATAILVTLFSGQVMGQANGDFRTRATGNWSSNGTWSRYNGTNWVDATSTPSSSSGAITILNGHTVTVTSNVSVDQVTINSGGQVTVNASITLTVANGSGTDLTNNGTFTVNGTVSNAGTITGAGTIQFNSGSTYNHSSGSGTIPTASWDANSTCEISDWGSSNTVFSGLEQNFGHFKISNPNGSNAARLNTSMSIQGDFIFASNGGRPIALSNSTTDLTLTIGGDLIISNGTFYIENGGDGGSSITVNGDFIQSGGTFNLSASSSGTVTLNVKGNFTHSGGSITETNGATGSIVFSKLGTQTYTSGGSISGTINFTVNSGSTLEMASASTTITGGGTFTLNGALISKSATGLDGHLLCTNKSFASTSDFVFSGSAAQTTGSLLPSSFRNLTIDNAAGVSLTGNRTITGTLNLTNGVLKTSTGNVLTLASGAAFARNTNGRGASSWVEGPLTKVGSGDFVFPLGNTGSGYSPLAITITGGSATSTDSYTAEYIFANASSSAGGPAFMPLPGSVSGKEYWSFVKNSGSAEITLTLTTKFNYPNNNNTKLFYVNGSLWQAAGGAYTSATPSTLVKTLFDDPTSSTTYYGYLTIGSTNSAGASTLPVKYGTVKASEKGRGVQIDWTAYDEHYLAGYQIERSADGIHFNAIGEVAAKNVTSETQYGFFDALPLSGNSFYRIRNLDIDGKSGLSNIVKINLNKNIKTISIYPNPLRGNRVSFQTSDLAQGTYNVELINAVGMRVFAQTISHAGGAINQGLSLPSNLKSGQYTLRINGNTTSSNHQLIILQ